MSSQSLIGRSLFAVLMCCCFFVDNVYGQTVTLSPDPLNIEINTMGSMTATLSEAAQAGGQTLILAATPAGVVSVPGEVVVSSGLTTITFQVTAGGVPGTTQVTVSAPSFVGDSATVEVTLPVVETNCKMAVKGATHAARAYVKAVDTAERLCLKMSPACTTAISEATTALNILNQAHGVVVTTCH